MAAVGPPLTLTASGKRSSNALMNGATELSPAFDSGDHDVTVGKLNLPVRCDRGFWDSVPS